MVSGDDERGQSVLIGSILLFGILVIAFAGYQAFAVPNQNSDVEFEHFQDVENQFTGLHSNIVNAVESDEERSVRLDLGMRYPPRLIALNPPPVDGQLRTTEAREVTITNASGGGITNEVCGAGATSRSLIYSPGYNEFQNAQSITYENTFATRTYRDGTIYGDQQFLRGNKIDLTLLNGSVSKSETGAYSLNINGSHRYRKSGEVTDPTITLPTQFSAGVWNSQIINDRSDVTATPNGSNHVDLSFTGDYRISCAVAGLDSDPAFTPPEEREETVGSANKTFDTQWVEADGESVNDDTVVSIERGETMSTTVEILGRESGNPIENLKIFNDDSDDLAVAGDTDSFDSFSFPGNQTTDSNGQIDINVKAADGATGGDRFETYVTAGDDSDVLTFEIEDVGTTMAERTDITSAATTNNKGSIVDFNVDTSGDDGIVITGLGIDYAEGETENAEQVDNGGGDELVFDGGGYFNAGGGNNGIVFGDQPADFEADGSGGSYETVTGGESTTGTLKEFEDSITGGNSVDMEGATLEITLEFEDGSSETYTITVN